MSLNEKQAKALDRLRGCMQRLDEGFAYNLRVMQIVISKNSAEMLNHKKFAEQIETMGEDLERKKAVVIAILREFLHTMKEEPPTS